MENDGKLVFEAETLKAVPTQLNFWRGSIYPCDNNKFIIANFLDLRPQDNVGSTVCRYELVDTNTVIKTEIEIIKVRLYDPEKLKTLLHEIGFNQIKMVKAFNLKQIPTQEDEVIVYECGK
ncbi:MAG: hypothetical protein KIT56_06060 [Gammaproteobacteria bacterium]|nr:hypothetical protein [Gammaproteobacteria bacterium]MCW5583434.1 hypothetical protein [Gammaproteobacteria bacterium]